MEAPWTDPSAYDDRDLARTIGQLDGFFNQAMSDDGRGLTAFAPPDAVREAVDSALSQLGESSSGTFPALCTREMLLGQIVGIHISKGGVPKQSIQRAKVGIGGIEGDVQRARQHHGRPWQALCLWADETLLKLQGEGHRIERGSAGENLTLSGIDWTQATCGSLLVCGELVAELTLFTLPCSKNARWFRDGDFNRMHHAAEPGVSRMYASVLVPGVVCVGDSVTLHLR
jgi:MOSC domain-containing protein YiiM